MNRFECKTCPYQMLLDKRYYERKRMKSKEVEDVLGGADSWRNVDRTEGEFRNLIYSLCLPSCLSGDFGGPRARNGLAWLGLLIVVVVVVVCEIHGALLTVDVVNCANERCDNRGAYFRQVQIRSADEPMTTFYKVSLSCEGEECEAD